MASGGAWQSETYDNGRDYQKPVLGAQVGAPPALYNGPAGAMGAANRGGFGVLALSLRIAQIVLTLIAFSIMAANKQTIYSSYYTYYASTLKFSNVKAFVGVLAMNCIVCLYAVGQLVQSIVSMASSGSFISSATTGAALLTFVFDTVLAYALVAAAAASADSAAILSDAGYDSYTKFTQKGQASVAMTFLAFIVLAASAALYPIRLRKVASTL